MLFGYVLFGLVGLALGSFGNVLIARIRSGERLGGRSKCMHCETILGIFELFPLVSYLGLRGRCKHCKKQISIRYPLTELLSLAAFLFAYWLIPGEPLQAFLTGVALAFLAFSVIYDAWYEKVPDAFTLFIAIAAAVMTTMYGDIKLSLIGAGIALLWFGGQWTLSRGRAVGTGDILLGLVLGFWLGFPGTITLIALSYMAGALILVILLGFRVISLKRQRIAFVPFLALGTVLTLIGMGEMYMKMVL